MRNYDVPRSKLFAQALYGLSQSLVIRDKDLQEIANLSQFRWRTDKIWNRTWRAVPHENLKSFLAQIRAHRPADNSEADYSNNFSIWAEHTKSNARGDGQYFREGQTAGKSARRQRRSLRIPGKLNKRRPSPDSRSFSKGGSPSPTF